MPSRWKPSRTIPSPFRKLWRHARPAREASPSTTALDTTGHVASAKTIVPAAWLTSVLLRRREGAAGMAIGTSLAVLAAEVIKRNVSRQRPRLFVRTPWRSFPSGHSAASTAYALGLALVAPRDYWPVALGTACVGATTVNARRVRARQHWATDVVAGDALGVLGVATAYVALRAIRRLRDERSTGGPETATA